MSTGLEIEIVRHFVSINKLIILLVNAVGFELALWVYFTNRRERVNQLFFFFHSLFAPLGRFWFFEHFCNFFIPKQHWSDCSFRDKVGFCYPLPLFSFLLFLFGLFSQSGEKKFNYRCYSVCRMVVVVHFVVYQLDSQGHFNWSRGCNGDKNYSWSTFAFIRRGHSDFI